MFLILGPRKGTWTPDTMLITSEQGSWAEWPEQRQHEDTDSCGVLAQPHCYDCISRHPGWTSVCWEAILCTMEYSTSTHLVLESRDFSPPPLS